MTHSYLLCVGIIASAGARAALSAIRSTLIVGHESHVRSVCKPTTAANEGPGFSGNTDAVAAVAAAAAEQLGGAAAPKRAAAGRGSGKGTGGRGSDKLLEYPVECVVDGDTGALLLT